MSCLAPRLRTAASTSALAAHSATDCALSEVSPQISFNTISTSTPKTRESACARRSRDSRRHGALQGRSHALQQIDAVAAREQRLVAERAGLALRPLVQRKLQCRLEGGLELVDARHRGRQQVGNAGACIGAIGRPVEYRPQSFVHHGMHERGLAWKVTVGRCARHFGGLGDFAYRRSDAGLHEPRCRFEHQFSRAGTRASLGGSGGFVLLT